MTEALKSRILAIAVGGPLAATTIAVVAFAALELRGQTPFSLGPVGNIAEAAALGHASEVLRLLHSGEDPNRVWPVRRDIISSTITQVTALEAAVFSRREQLVEFLDREGAIVGDESRRHVACLANDLSSPVEEVVHYLFPHGPPACTPGEAFTAVLERSREP